MRNSHHHHSNRQNFGFPTECKSPVLIPEMSGRKGSMSSNSSTTSAGKRSRTSGKMKLIIALGVILPVVAAVIGVTAWAVSAADSVFMSKRSRLRAEEATGAFDDRYLDVLESRNDLDHSSNNLVSMYSKADPDLSPSRLADAQNRIIGSSHDDSDDHRFHLPTLPPPKSEAASDDPLYIVHFVPSPAPKSAAEDSMLASNENNSQFINKIISATKAQKTGVPQFVVFAPAPGMEATSNNANMPESSVASQLKENGASAEPAANKPQFDYEYDERDMKNFPHSNADTADQKMSRQGLLIGSTAQQHRGPQTLVDNSSTGHQTYQPIAQSDPYKQKQVHQQALVRTAHSSQTVQQNHQQYYQAPSTPMLQQTQHQQPSLPQVLLSNTQNYQQQPQQQNLPPAAPYNQAIAQNVPNTDATNRLGEIGPLGIKLSFGNGGGDGGYAKGYDSGGYAKGHDNGGLSGFGGLRLRPFSPLGLIQGILRPVIPRANANLNGKVMFGLMLENGIKFGDRKPQQHYG